MKQEPSDKSHSCHGNSLHLVVYTDSTGIGGAEISLGHLVATVSSKFNLTVVGVNQEVVAAIASRRPQAAQIVLPGKGNTAFIAHLLTFQRLRPHILHINCCTPWANGIASMAALFLSQTRLVRVDQLPLRTTDIATLWRTRALCLRMDAHVAVGLASARRMEDFYALGRNSVISIPNGVPDVDDVDLIQPPNLFSSHHVMTIGSIGRLNAMKAHDILLRAVAQVENVQVVILGEGEERTQLEQLAIQLNIAERVKLLGWIEHPRFYLSSFDVVAMPSRSEGFPLAMVESMLAACPVIATRVGSMPEAIIPYETGLLIEKDDVAGLAKALRQLRDDSPLRLRLGQQARLAALENWTVEAMTTKYERLWHDLLTAPANPRFRVPRPKD